jgi:hypothetical protein
MNFLDIKNEKNHFSQRTRKWGTHNLAYYGSH